MRKLVWNVDNAMRTDYALARNAVTVCALVATIGCGSVGKAAERGAARALRAEVARVVRRDVERDATLIAKPLTKPRTVFRYTTREQAAREVEVGLRSGSHMTVVGGGGRPLSASSARARYGLPNTPEVRETVKLPAGLPIKSGKVIAGGRGVGEVTSPKSIPAAAITRIAPIPPSLP